MGAKFYGNAIGQEGWKPTFSYIDASAEDLSTVISPGFVNSLLAAGNNLDKQSLLVVAYNAGTQIFQQTDINGLITLSIYSPGDNSFPFTSVQFVAKGGSDLNSGNTLGSPKLTIQAAMDAFPISNDYKLIWVMDAGSYNENIIMKPVCSLYAPNALISSSSGDTITLNDTGNNYENFINCNFLTANSGNNSIKINGAQSVLIANVRLFLGGNIDCVGGLSMTVNGFVGSSVHIASTGTFSPNSLFGFGNSYTFDVGSNISGFIGQDQFGRKVFNNKITFQQDELQETTGRTLAVDDGVSTIQFNSVSDANYTLPQTSAVAIPIGSVVTWVEIGTGRVIFIAGAGVTIISIVGALTKTTGAGAKAFAEKLTDTVWVVSGDIEIAP